MDEKKTLLLELLNKAKDIAVLLLQSKVGNGGNGSSSSTTTIINEFNTPADYNHDEYKQKTKKLVQYISTAIGYTNSINLPSSSSLEPNNNKGQQKQTESNNNKNDNNLKLLELLDKCVANANSFNSTMKRNERSNNNTMDSQQENSNLIEQTVHNARVLAQDLLIPCIEEYQHLTSPPTRQRHLPIYDEYKLIIKDESCTTLRHILMYCLGSRCLVWITSNSCILQWDYSEVDRVPNFVIPDDYYCIWVSSPGSPENQSPKYAIYGRTEADSVNCLLYLLNLPPVDHEDIWLSFCTFVRFRFSGHLHQVWDINESEERFLCPIDHIHLEAALLCSSKQKHLEYRFTNTIFTASQSYVLAKTIMAGNSIEFRSCSFEDEGSSFADVFCNVQQRMMVKSSDRGTVMATTATDDNNQDAPSTMAKIELKFATQTSITRTLIDGCEEPPFHPSHWNRLLSSGGLSNIRLCLDDIIFSPDYCEGFTNCTAQSLRLRYCDYASGNVFGYLADAIRHNRGPREIGFHIKYSNENDDGFQRFLEVLGKDEHQRVKKLCIDFQHYRTPLICTSLLNALRSNQSLEHLQVLMHDIGGICDAIQDHPTISTIEFSAWRSQTINILSSLLKKNQVIENIISPYDGYRELATFEERILPLLVLNKYRKIFHRYRTYRLREAALALALTRVSSMNNPSLLFMLVADTIGTHSSNDGVAQQHNFVAAENNNNNNKVGVAKRQRIE